MQNVSHLPETYHGCTTLVDHTWPVAFLSTWGLLCAHQCCIKYAKYNLNVPDLL